MLVGLSGLAALGLLAPPTDADVVAAATASGQYAYNSNVFDLQPGFNFPGTVITKRDDWFQGYSAALQINDRYSRQQLYLTALGSDYLYDFYTQLNHTDYTLKAGWNWGIGSAWSGLLEIRRERDMVAFSEVIQAQLAQQTEQRERATVDLHLGQKWLLEDIGNLRRLQEPLVGLSDLTLTENSDQLSLRYINGVGLNIGPSVTYLTGNFSGDEAAANPSYRQVTGAVQAIYQATGHSSFVGQAGYSRRTSQAATDNVAGTTAQLVYSNQLTGKTSLNVNLARTLDSYITNAGSEVDTLASATIIWQATYKLGLNAGYSITERFLPNQGAESNPDRTDHVQIIALKLSYEPLDWLWIRPYLNLQTRRSSLDGENFDANEFGIYFSVQLNCNQPGTPGPLQIRGVATCPTD